MHTITLQLIPNKHRWFGPSELFIVYQSSNMLICVSPGYGLLFLFMAATPVLRSKLSKLVDPSEQGQSLNM